MSISDEKVIIYQLMREIIEERRELSKQYFDLKSKLDDLEHSECSKQMNRIKSITVVEKSKPIKKDYYFKKDGVRHHNSFDRVSMNVISILKQSAVPLSNRQILNKLTKDYELSISLKNLTCNILPKMKNERSLPIQRAYRGYWQYKRSSRKGAVVDD